MQTRVKQAQLENLVERINKAENRPTATYVRTDDGYKAQIGNLYIDGAYGGVALCEITESTGTITYHYPSGMGHIPKRELYTYLQGRLAGSGVDA